MHTISVRPQIRYPRKTQVGATCVMTVDLEHSIAPEDWPYAEEEYPIHCFLDTGPLFEHEPIGNRTIVVHRFGGSYGPAMFRLRAQSAGSGSMRITLGDRAGVLIAVIPLENIEVHEASPLRARRRPGNDAGT